MILALSCACVALLVGFVFQTIRRREQDRWSANWEEHAEAWCERYVRHLERDRVG